MQEDVENHFKKLNASLSDVKKEVSENQSKKLRESLDLSKLNLDKDRFNIEKDKQLLEKEKFELEKNKAKVEENKFYWLVLSGIIGFIMTLGLNYLNSTKTKKENEEFKSQIKAIIRDEMNHTKILFNKEINSNEIKNEKRQ